MSQSDPKELKQAKKFIKEGRYEESLQILKDFEERKNNTLQEIVSCHLLMCDLFFTQGLSKKAVKLADQTYKESLGLEKNFKSFDALVIMAKAFLMGNDIKTANKIINQGEELLKTLTEVSVIKKNRNEAVLSYLKGMSLDSWISPINDDILALKHYKHSLSLAESVENKKLVISNLLRIAWNFGNVKGELDLALDYIEKALVFSKDTKDNLYILWALHHKATIYGNKGDIKQAISLFKQSLALGKELNNRGFIASTLNNMAEVYRMKGDLDHALDCSEQSLKIFSKISDLKVIANIHDYLIQILIEKGDLEQAQEKFNQLEQINNQLNDKETNEIYLYNKALLLKKSSRISNRGKAEVILKQMLEEDLIFLIKPRVLLTLCELLLSELQMTGDLEALDEIESYIAQLLDSAEKSHSYWILGETYLLQGKLALISLDLEEARRILTQGQQISEKNGLDLLANRISNEHDELLKQLSLWENLKKSNTPLNERIKLAGLNKQIGNMIKKRVIEIPELSDEAPVLLLIVSEGGISIFSHSFEADQGFEDHLFGGFFTTINSFINEKFSEGLDRAIFGEHTLLMNAISPFFICYVFKGQSYSAQQRVGVFIDKIQNNRDIWQAFEKHYHMNQEIQLKDIPSLEPLITEVFIDRNIPIKV
jgi:tetratricopeptide (TPR) repeat protein